MSMGQTMLDLKQSQYCERVIQVKQQVLEITLRDLPQDNIPSLPLETYY
jgi:hypothetical protein